MDLGKPLAKARGHSSQCVAGSNRPDGSRPRLRRHLADMPDAVGPQRAVRVATRYQLRALRDQPGPVTPWPPRANSTLWSRADTAAPRPRTSPSARERLRRSRGRAGRRGALLNKAACSRARSPRDAHSFSHADCEASLETERRERVRQPRKEQRLKLLGRETRQLRAVASMSRQQPTAPRSATTGTPALPARQCRQERRSETRAAGSSAAVNRSWTCKSSMIDSNRSARMA